MSKALSKASSKALSRARSKQTAAVLSALVSAFAMNASPSVAWGGPIEPLQPTANSAGAQTEAQAAMERGIAAFGKGDAEGALAEYERAIRLVPIANLPYRYAAEALLQLNRPKAAIEYLEKYLAINRNVSDAATVQSRIEALKRERLPGKLKLSATVDGTRVRVDKGEPLLLPIEIELPPGDHLLLVERQGYASISERVHLVGNERTELVLRVGPSLGPSFGSSRQLTLEPTREPSATSSGLPAIGVASVVTLGLGGITLITTGVLDATLLQSKMDELNSASQRGASNLVQVRDDAAAARTGIIAGYVVGTAITIGGAVLFTVWQLSGRDTKTPGMKAGFTSPFAYTF